MQAGTTKQETIFYKITPKQRRDLLLDCGFRLDGAGVWRHPNGQAIGKGAMLALCDAAFSRFLGKDDLAITA